MGRPAARHCHPECTSSRDPRHHLGRIHRLRGGRVQLVHDGPRRAGGHEVGQLEPERLASLFERFCEEVRSADPAFWAQWDAYRAEDGDYAGACLPFGLVRSINAPHPMQIVQSKNFIAFLHEQNTWFTKVPTDGRPFPKDNEMDPTWFGTSRGHWEGDTLVIETKNFNGKTRLDTIGHPHSEKMSVRETWTLMNPTQVYYTIEINDPRTYKEPIKSERTFTRDPNGEVMEYSCEENNKSLLEGRIKVPDFAEWLK